MTILRNLPFYLLISALFGVCSTVVAQKRSSINLNLMGGPNKIIFGIDDHTVSRNGISAQGEITWRYKPRNSVFALNLGLSGVHHGFKGQLDETFDVLNRQYRVAITPLAEIDAGTRWRFQVGFSTSRMLWNEFELQHKIQNGIASNGYDELGATFHPTSVQTDIVLGVLWDVNAKENVHLIMRLQQAANQFITQDYTVRPPFSNQPQIIFKEGSLPTTLFLGISVRLNDRKKGNSNKRDGE